MKNISILGGGWLGFPLGKKLAENYNIKISTTSVNKISLFTEAGLEAFLFEVPNDNSKTDISSFFKNCDILIITIPPNKKNSEKFDYVKKIEWIISKIENNKIKQVIYTSSTSVYDGLINEVNELSVLNENNSRAEEIIINEQKLLNNENFNATILRLGGLFGKDRHPVKFLVKKSVIDNGNEPVNMLHLNDTINAIETLIKKPIENEVYNLVFPQHDSREVFYKNAATKLGFSLPEFQTVNFPKNRKVSSSKFQKAFDFTFKYFE